MNEIDFGLTQDELESLDQNAQSSHTTCEGGDEGATG
jgi:hypothetical protein